VEAIGGAIHLFADQAHTMPSQVQQPVAATYRLRYDSWSPEGRRNLAKDELCGSLESEHWIKKGGVKRRGVEAGQP
jgi:hypothetical protein